MEVIQTLREFYIAGELGKIQAGDLIIGPHKYPKDCPTAFRSNRGKGKPYTLETVWFCLKNEAITEHSSYVAACTANNVPMVSLIDKAEIIAWLKGKVATVLQVDETVTLSLPPSAQPTTEVKDNTKQTEDALAAQSQAESTPTTDGPSQQKPDDSKALDKFAQESGMSLAKIGSIKTKLAQKKKVPQEDKVAEARQKVYQDIVQREKLSQTHTTVLQCQYTKKNFNKILNQVKEIKRKDKEKEDEIKRVQQQKQARKERQKEEAKKPQPQAPRDINFSVPIDLNSGFTGVDLDKAAAVLSASSGETGPLLPLPNAVISSNPTLLPLVTTWSAPAPTSAPATTPAPVASSTSTSSDGKKENAKRNLIIAQPVTGLVPMKGQLQ